jgi:hypothetical protein
MTNPPNPPTFTTSERRSLKRCPQAWWWRYREGLRVLDPDIKLWFGIGIHEVLAHYYGNKGYKRNNDFLDVWKAYCDTDDYSRAVRTKSDANPDQSNWVSARDLGIVMLNGYVDWYDVDADWDVIYTEEPFQIEIPDPYDTSLTAGVFTSTFDGVYRDRTDGLIKLMEHKTAAVISTGHLALDDQGGAYWAVATQVLRDKGVLGSKESIAGITYNFLRKAEPDDRPRNAQGLYLNKPTKAEMKLYGPAYPGSVSKVQPKPLFERHFVRRTRREQRHQILRLAQELFVANAYRDGSLPIIKNPTRDCSWDCEFAAMCQLHERGGNDWQEFKEGVYLVEDPYIRYRRKSASE